MNDDHIYDEVIDVESLESLSVAGLSLVTRPDALVRPAASVSDIERAFHDYQSLCARLLDADDIQKIGGRSFRKKSAWRKLAVAFGVSCQVIDRIYDRDDEGHIHRAEVVVRATAPNGRFMEGLGVCDISERKFSKVEHDIPATAMTRATNRACADLFGMGEVSAEEMSQESHSYAQPVRTQAAKPEVDVDAMNALIESVRELPEAYREKFKEQRKSASIEWPVPSSKMSAALNIVTALKAQAERDAEPF
ncbi:hypothetical protein UFOVP1305_20 [uncultured Caudovirales phage]|uniref:Uncharacterized protein n=1 Tax=uncultured Caudovirales phage TaxID=2100421 RepID=A0A6J5PQ09_9CAUD|nr:hypothetical protein UFOVP896_58 [uncultured Caudovirales phage]CAB4197549.1 hypothetical protein UFOVP1305_20 [uncultured Caudovirales phage]